MTSGGSFVAVITETVEKLKMKAKPFASEPFWGLKRPDFKDHLAERGWRKFLPAPAPSLPLH